MHIVGISTEEKWQKYFLLFGRDDSLHIRSVINSRFSVYNIDIFHKGIEMEYRKS